MKEKWNQFKRKIPRLSRKQRLLRNVVCVPILLFLCWVLWGMPTFFSDRATLHLREHLEMVGPSEYLDTIRVPEGLEGYEEMIVGESEHGVSLHPVNREFNTISSIAALHYTEKRGDVTLILAPTTLWPREGENTTLLWLLFCDVNAARAEVELTLGYAGYEYVGTDYTRKEIYYERTYSLSAEVEEGGYFLLPQFFEPLDSEEEDILWRLDLRGRDRLESREGPACAKVRLYGADGTLLQETVIDLTEDEFIPE